MPDNTLTIIVVLVFIIAPFWLIYRMDKRVTKRGALFTGQPTGLMRLLALVFGVIFAGISIFEAYTTQEVSIVFPLIAFGLIAYGLGAGQLLAKFQKQGPSIKPNTTNLENVESAVGNVQNDMRLIPQNRFTRFLMKISIILIISAIILCAAWLASTHSNNPLSWIFVIGVIVLIILARVLDWFRLFKNLFK